MSIPEAIDVSQNGRQSFVAYESTLPNDSTLKMTVSVEFVGADSQNIREKSVRALDTRSGLV